MLVTCEIYGSDADGNRGMLQYYAELLDEDVDWIYEQISENFEPEKKYYTVFQEDEDGREFEFEVDIQDWLESGEYDELLEQYYDDMKEE